MEPLPQDKGAVIYRAGTAAFDGRREEENAGA